ncbi:MAG: hypothetical protein ABMA26_26290, partial [Limisphaerales bacterium]
AAWERRADGVLADTARNVDTKPIFLLLAQAAGRDTPEQRKAFAIFAVFWVVLAIASFAFFHLHRDTKLKRRVFPFFVVGVGLVFAAFIGFMTQGFSQAVFLFFPVIALITFLNIRCTHFCDSCGRTLFRQPVFSRPCFCPHCGAQLP